MMSTWALSARAPSIIVVNSAAEADSPFIFQLPATSGRRGAPAMFALRICDFCHRVSRVVQDAPARVLLISSHKRHGRGLTP